MDRVHRKLFGWEKRNLSFGGRITILKSVLSALLIYYLSFFKAPECIISALIKMQRISCVGKESGRKIACVKWSSVCLSKSVVSMGVKDIRSFNVAL